MSDSETILFDSQVGNFTAVSKSLIEGVSPDFRNNEGYTPLQIACANGCNEIAELLLDYGADIDLPNIYGWGPLMHASRNGHAPTVSLLLKRKAKVNVYNKLGMSPVLAAIWSGNLEVVKKLLEAGATLDHSSEHNECSFTSAMAASVQGHEDVLKFLLDSGVDVNLASHVTGLTPLMVAANAGRTNIVRILVHWGSDANKLDVSSKTALDHSSKTDNEEVKSLLEGVTTFRTEQGCNQPSDIFQAIRNGDIMKVKALLSEDPESANAVDVCGYLTPLLLVSMLGDTRMARILIARGVDLNQQEKENGWTALMYAVFYRHSDMVELLLEKGVNVDVRAFNGNTALDFARHIDGSETIVDNLIAKLVTGVSTLNVQDVPSRLRLSVAEGPRLSARRSLSQSQHKSWIGGVAQQLQSHLSPRLPNATSSAEAQGQEESSNDVFDEPTSPVADKSNVYGLPPDKYLADELKEQKVEAIPPPFPPTSIDYVDAIRGISPKQLIERKKTLPKKVSLRLPHLLKQHSVKHVSDIIPKMNFKVNTSPLLGRNSYGSNVKKPPKESCSIACSSKVIELESRKMKKN